VSLQSIDRHILGDRPLKLACPNCGETIPADKINIQETLALCPRCDTIFRFDKSAVSTLAQRKGRNLPQPPKLHVHESETGVQIRYRWIENLNGLLIGFAAMFAVGTAVLIAIGLGIMSEGGLGALAVGSLFLLGAMFCLYLLMTVPLNSSIFTLDDEELSHIEEPLYGFDNHRFPRAEVEQVIAKDISGDNSMEGYLNLIAVMHNGTEKKLAQYLKAEHALYIAQVMNEYLTAERVHTADHLFAEDDDSDEAAVPALMNVPDDQDQGDANAARYT
jgi:hypothetical protein